MHDLPDNSMRDAESIPDQAGCFGLAASLAILLLVAIGVCIAGVLGG